MLAGIREILIISTPQDLPRFRELLGDGAQWGMRVRVRRAAAAPTAWRRRSSSAASSSASDRVALVLGDNIFYGHGLHRAGCSAPRSATSGATVFGYYVKDPERYGVVEFDAQRHARSASRRSPTQPQVELRRHRPLLLRQPGARHRRATSSPSPRGELEITDVNARLPASAGSSASS